MESPQTSRSARSLFEMGEIRASGARPARPANPNDPPAEKTPESRHKNVALTDRQLSLTIGAIEKVMASLRDLPGTEGTFKEYDVARHILQQALAVLPSATRA